MYGASVAKYLYAVRRAVNSKLKTRPLFTTKQKVYKIIFLTSKITMLWDYYIYFAYMPR